MVPGPRPLSLDATHRGIGGSAHDAGLAVGQLDRQGRLRDGDGRALVRVPTAQGDLLAAPAEASTAAPSLHGGCDAGFACWWTARSSTDDRFSPIQG